MDTKDPAGARRATMIMVILAAFAPIPRRKAHRRRRGLQPWFRGRLVSRTSPKPREVVHEEPAENGLVALHTASNTRWSINFYAYIGVLRLKRRRQHFRVHSVAHRSDGDSLQ
jgi:hypothetical protein